MPGTILQTLPKMKDGQLLFESFESDNFTEDQDWDLLNGTPAISQDVAKVGLKSFELDLTYPQIEKSFTERFKWSAGWFYDDAAVVTGGFTPFMTWVSDTGQVYGLGVDLSVSTTHYTRIVNGTASASSVARVTGFHDFAIRRTVLDIVSLIIDDVAVGSDTSVTPLQKVQVGCYVYSGTTAFGFFDAIQVNLDADVKVYQLEDGQVLKVYEEDGTLVSSATAVGGIASVLVNDSDIILPFQGYVTVTREDGLTPFYWGAVQSLAGGSLYSLSIYRFGRRATFLDTKPTAMRMDKESNAGKQQSVYFFGRQTGGISFSDLTEDQKNELVEWWTTAQLGSVFSIALDEGSAYKSLLTEAIETPDQLTFKPEVLYGIGKGSVVALKSATNHSQAVKKVASVSSPNVTVEQGFTVPFAIGDEVRDLYYWPQVLTNESTLNQMLTNVRLRRWNLNLSFKEAL